MKSVKFLVAAAILSIGCAACSNNSSNNDTSNDQQAQAPEVTVAQVAAGTSVTTLDDDNLLRANAPVSTYTVLDFNAVWCGPCKKLNAPMEEAAKAYDGAVAFYSVDFEKMPETAKSFDITDVPVVIIISPDGSMQRYDTLSPFISDQDSKEMDKEQAQAVIFNSLCGYINQAMGKE